MSSVRIGYSACLSNPMPAKRTLFPDPCPNCGKEIARRNRYCDNQCQNDYQYKEAIRKWLSGEITLGSPAAASGYVRKHLLEQFNNRCPKCGWGEVNAITGNVPLEINHIDGDATNNSPSNLELLCPNCHSLTPNFRNLNKGKSTRTYRNSRN